MPTIEILKNVNKVSTNKFDTVNIRISKYKYEKSGEFTVVRSFKGKVYDIKGWLKDGEFKETIDSTWDSIFSAGGSTIESINKLLVIAGIGSLKTKAMYTQIWTDTKPVEIPITLYFSAETDTFNDVIKPIRELQRMCVPSEKNKDNTDNNSGQTKSSNNISDVLGDNFKPILSSIKKSFFDKFLLPPSGSGLNLKNISKSDFFTAIDFVQIGNFLRFKDIVLQSVDVSWDMKKPDVTGRPKTAMVDLKFRSRSIWTNKTIDNLLQGVDQSVEPEVINIGAIGQKIADEVKKAFGGIF